MIYDNIIKRIEEHDLSNLRVENINNINKTPLVNALTELRNEEVLIRTPDGIPLSINEIKLLITASDDLSEAELNELLGFTRKKTLIKKIIELDPAADQEKLDRLEKGVLKKMLKDKREEAGEDTRGFFAKVADKVKGIKDIGLLGDKPGTLLGGEETFDIKKRNELKDRAGSQMANQLKTINYEPLTKLYSDLVKKKFPNNKNFAADRADILNVYEQVVQAHSAKELDTKTANVIISVIRAMVIYFQDFAISDQYYYRQGKMEENLSLADLLLLEDEQLDEAGVPYGTVSKNYEAAYGMKFPLGLALAGAGLMGAGVLAESEFAKNFLESLKDISEVNVPGKDAVFKSTTEALGTIPTGSKEKGWYGIIKVVRKFAGVKNFGLKGGPGLDDVFGGGKNEGVLDLIKAALSKPGEGGAAALDKAIQAGADPHKLFIEGPMSGRGGVGEELFGINSGTFTKEVSKKISDAIPDSKKFVESNTFRNTLLKGLKTWAGPALMGLGLATIVGAGVSAGMRVKGKMSSRQQMLHDLGKELKDVGDEEGEVTPPPPPPGGDDDDDVEPVPPPPVDESPCAYAKEKLKPYKRGDIVEYTAVRGPEAGKPLPGVIVHMPGEGNVDSFEKQCEEHPHHVQVKLVAIRGKKKWVGAMSAVRLEGPAGKLYKQPTNDEQKEAMDAKGIEYKFRFEKLEEGGGGEYARQLAAWSKAVLGGWDGKGSSKKFRKREEPYAPPGGEELEGPIALGPNDPATDDLKAAGLDEKQLARLKTWIEKRQAAGKKLNRKALSRWMTSGKNAIAKGKDNKALRVAIAKALINMGAMKESFLRTLKTKTLIELFFINNGTAEHLLEACNALCGETKQALEESAKPDNRKHHIAVGRLKEIAFGRARFL